MAEGLGGQPVHAVPAAIQCRQLHYNAAWQLQYCAAAWQLMPWGFRCPSAPAAAEYSTAVAAGTSPGDQDPDPTQQQQLLAVGRHMLLLHSVGLSGWVPGGRRVRGGSLRRQHRDWQTGVIQKRRMRCWLRQRTPRESS